MSIHVVGGATGSPLPARTQYIVYDLEMVGDTHSASTSYIWNVAAQPVDGETQTKPVFDALVLPDIWRSGWPPPAHPDLVSVTPKYLQQQHAQPWSVVGPDFLAWLDAQRRQPDDRLVLVSHGNHAFDKPMLEIEFGRSSIQLPPWLLFQDTLPLFRKALRKLSSYSLKAIYQHLFSAAVPDQHRAAADVEALRRCVRCVFAAGLPTQPGVYYPAYFIPLLCVRGIGSYNERLLVQGGVHCVTQLQSLLVHQCRMSTELMVEHLTTQYLLAPESAARVAESLLVRTLQPSG